MKGTDKLIANYNKITLILLAVLCSTQMLNTTELHGISAVSSIVSTISLVVLSVSEIIVVIKSLMDVKKAKESGTSLWKPLIPLLLLIVTVATTLLGSVEREEECILITISMLCILESMDYRDILRTVFRCGTVIVLLMFLLCMFGFVENNRGTGFGFIYRTDYTCHLLFLLLIFCFYYGGKISWKAFVGILILIGYTLIFVQGKTAAICMLLVLAVTLFKNLPVKAGGLMDRIAKNRGASSVNHVFLKIIEFSFPICAALMIGVSVFLSFNRSLAFSIISKTGTIGSRLHMSMVALEQFPITIFGKSIDQQGYGGSSGYMPFYYFLDSSYVRLLLQNGIIMFVLFLGIMTFLSVRLYKKNMFYELFILAVVALDCTLEHHMIDISYNVFAVLALAGPALGSSESIKPIFGPVKVESAQSPAPKRKIVKIAALVLALVVFAFACLTSFRIGNYSAPKPELGATVIIPGSAVDGIASDTLLKVRVKETTDYLRKHEESVCLLAASETENNYMRQLLQSGIDSERIHEITVSDKDIRNLQKSAEEYINENLLPSRRAYCLFPMQQYVVGNIAHSMGFSFNTLEAKTPAWLYFPLFFVQQFKTAGFLLGEYEK